MYLTAILLITLCSIHVCKAYLSNGYTIYEGEYINIFIYIFLFIYRYLYYFIFGCFETLNALSSSEEFAFLQFIWKA